jgi:hypothetical protein
MSRTNRSSSGPGDTITEMPGHEAVSQNDGRNFAESIDKNGVEMRYMFNYYIL